MLLEFGGKIEQSHVVYDQIITVAYWSNYSLANPREFKVQLIVLTEAVTRPCLNPTLSTEGLKSLYLAFPFPIITPLLPERSAGETKLLA